MTATQIIAELQKMPAQEVEKVIEFLEINYDDEFSTEEQEEIIRRG